MVEYEYAYIPDTETSIHVDDAIKSKDYKCIDCEAIVHRRAGSFTPHFYHIPGQIPHKASKETILHNNAKHYMYNLLLQTLTTNQSILIHYDCPWDSYRYEKIPINPSKSQLLPIRPNFDFINLPINTNIDEVLIEKQTAGTYIPDVSLMKNGELHTAIEIENTHENTEEKLAYYQNHGINLVNIEINSDDDYDLLKKSIISIDSSLTEKSYFYGTGCELHIETTKEMLIAHQKELNDARLQAMFEAEYKKAKEEADREWREAQQTLKKANSHSFRIDELIRFSKKLSQISSIPNRLQLPKPPEIYEESVKINQINPEVPKIFQLSHPYNSRSYYIDMIYNTSSLFFDYISSQNPPSTLTIYGIARDIEDEKPFNFRIHILKALIYYKLIKITPSGYIVKSKTLPQWFLEDFHTFFKPTQIYTKAKICRYHYPTPDTFIYKT